MAGTEGEMDNIDEAGEISDEKSLAETPKRFIEESLDIDEYGVLSAQELMGNC